MTPGPLANAQTVIVHQGSTGAAGQATTLQDDPLQYTVTLNLTVEPGAPSSATFSHALIPPPLSGVEGTLPRYC